MPHVKPLKRRKDGDVITIFIHPFSRMNLDYSVVVLPCCRPVFDRWSDTTLTISFIESILYLDQVVRSFTLVFAAVVIFLSIVIVVLVLLWIKRG